MQIAESALRNERQRTPALTGVSGGLLLIGPIGRIGPIRPIYQALRCDADKSFDAPEQLSQPSRYCRLQ
jgi:hypothetical protein